MNIVKSLLTTLARTILCRLPLLSYILGTVLSTNTSNAQTLTWDSLIGRPMSFIAESNTLFENCAPAEITMTIPYLSSSTSVSESFLSPLSGLISESSPTIEPSAFTLYECRIPNFAMLHFLSDTRTNRVFKISVFYTRPVFRDINKLLNYDRLFPQPPGTRDFDLLINFAIQRYSAISPYSLPSGESTEYFDLFSDFLANPQKRRLLRQADCINHFRITRERLGDFRNHEYRCLIAAETRENIWWSASSYEIIERNFLRTPNTVARIAAYQEFIDFDIEAEVMEIHMQMFEEIIRTQRERTNIEPRETLPGEIFGRTR